MKKATWLFTCHLWGSSSWLVSIDFVHNCWTETEVLETMAPCEISGLLIIYYLWQYDGCEKFRLIRGPKLHTYTLTWMKERLALLKLIEEVRKHSHYLINLKRLHAVVFCIQNSWIDQLLLIFLNLFRSFSRVMIPVPIHPIMKSMRLSHHSLIVLHTCWLPERILLLSAYYQPPIVNIINYRSYKQSA